MISSEFTITCWLLDAHFVENLLMKQTMYTKRPKNINCPTTNAGMDLKERLMNSV